MIAELISVGTELLLGNIVNTNSNYLAKKCAELGITNYYQVTVGDNEERLCNTIKTALSRCDILILSGGLGPTTDDLTKEITAKALGRNLIQDLLVKKSIEDYFKDPNLRDIPDNNWKQSYIIEGSTVVENHNGTAPGLIVETEDNKIVILLPGPPRELIPMFEKTIMPYLRSYLPGTYYSKIIKICGIGESKAATMVGDLIDNQTNPTIAPYAKLGEVNFRITASANGQTEAEELIRPVVNEFKKRFGNQIFTTIEEETLEDVVVSLLSKHGLKLSTAESCTGGLLSSKIINVSGASSVFEEGFITYSNIAKEKYLGVNKKTLDRYGAVSSEVAKEMVLGTARNTGSEACLAITGLAGPTGGSKEKPVGLVYIASFLNNNVEVKEYRFNGNRQTIRERTVVMALDLLRLSIMNTL